MAPIQRFGELFSILVLPALIVVKDLFMGCNIPGGGLGYVASNDIPQGTLLLEEYPIFRLPDGATEADVQARLAQQPRGVQNQFLALFIGHQYLQDGNYLGRFRANALQCGTEGGRKVAGLLPLAARFNHSCRPNIAYQWDQHSGVMRFYANSTIPTAQELCISYDPTSILCGRATRQARLRSSTGFLCHCAACIVMDRESDDRRTALYRVIVTPGQWTAGETQVGFLAVSVSLDMLLTCTDIHRR